MIYAKFDINGNIIAFYKEGLHNPDLYKGCIGISDEQHVYCINNPGKWIVVNNELKLAPQKTKEEILKEAKESRAIYINHRYTLLIQCPVSYKTESGYEGSFSCSESALSKIDSVLSHGEYKQNVWQDYSLRVVSPFSHKDLLNLKKEISKKLENNITHKDLMIKLGLVNKAKTIEEVNSVDFED